MDLNRYMPRFHSMDTDARSPFKGEKREQFHRDMNMDADMEACSPSLRVKRNEALILGHALHGNHQHNNAPHVWYTWGWMMDYRQGTSQMTKA